MVWSKKLGHRSVREAIKIFCGWNILEASLEYCGETTRLLVLSLFKTGGRISEVLSIYREQMDIDDRRIRVIDMPVLKRHLSYVPTRTVPVRMDERLTKDWLSLFPRKGKFFGFKYDKAYRLIRDLEKEEGESHGPWWPHRYRAERARQLVKEYDFDALHLKQFFDMARLETPIHYASPSLRSVEERMGI